MKKSKIADISLLFVAFIWGATFVIVQNAISTLEPFTFNAVRFGLASLFLFSWLVLFHKKQFTLWNKRLFLSGIIMGFWLFSAYALQTFGLLYTTSSKSGFITGLSVVLVPLLAYCFLNQKPKPFSIIGVLIATIGLYLLTLSESLTTNVGDILTFFCAIAFATHIILTGKYTSHYPTLLLTVTQIGTVSFLSWLSAFLFEDWTNAFSLQIIRTLDVWFALLITSIFATALAYIAQTSFQKHTTPTRVALIFATEPVFAAITAVAFVNETLTNKAIWGCLFIFIGMILAELPQKNFISLKKKQKIRNSKQL